MRSQKNLGVDFDFTSITWMVAIAARQGDRRKVICDLNDELEALALGSNFVFALQNQLPAS